MEFHRPNRERPVSLILPALILIIIIALSLFFFLGKEQNKEKQKAVIAPTRTENAERAIKMPAFTGFTEWMTPSEMDAHIRLLNAGHMENFWDRGHWIIAAEGRWENGIHEFRIAYDKSPPEKQLGWKYKINQTQEAFTRAIDRYALEGYTLISSQSFQRPDDTKRYQAVWHQVSAAAHPLSEALYESEAKTESNEDLKREKEEAKEDPLSGLKKLDFRDAARN